MDDDDEWLPNKLKIQVEKFEKLPVEYGMLYCWMDYYENGELIYEHHPQFKGYVFGNILDKQRLGGCPTLLIRKNVVIEFNGFDDNLPRGNDGDFIRRICQKYKVDLIPEVLVKVHVGHGKKRISDNNHIGIRLHIQSQRSKLDKFKNILHIYPDPIRLIYINLAHSYAKLNIWKKFVYYYIKAFRISSKAPFKIREIFYFIKIQFKKHYY